MNKSMFEVLAKENFNKGIFHKALLLKGQEQKQLFELARKKRRDYFLQEKVEVRSVIEISNNCQRKCNFCNINFYFRNQKKYLISFSELIKIVGYIYHRKNRRVVMLQSGENRSQKYIDFVCRCTNTMKRRYKDLIIVLCLGSLKQNQYRQLRASGADRYILKFETSNPALYKQIKPDDCLEKRVECINKLAELGFEVGTGNIIGLPNQSIKDIVNDLCFIKNFKLKMVSTSVFIPGENSNYRGKPIGDINLTLNYMALMRIIYPQMLIPSTSSLEKAKTGAQYLGLMSGANAVTIHDGTPPELKKHFPIYSINRFIPRESHIKKIVARAHLHFV